MTVLLYFLQINWEKLRPENLFGGQVLERTPAGLSIIYLIGLAVLLGFLLISFFSNFRRPQFNFERDLPKEVKRKLTKTVTNRSLRIWQFVFIALAFTVFGFHVYWAVFAEKDGGRFQELSSRDLRTRRAASSQLRGWMLDRSGKLVNALAYYKRQSDGGIVRTYPLDHEMAQLLGTELGTPGLERTLYAQKADPMPEAWEVLTKIKRDDDTQRDVRITIDRDLQTYLAKELDGKTGAIVVPNPQTGEVLGIYSNPSFSLSEIKDANDLHRLERDKKNRPLLSRALREYYVPGSTFKTFTMMNAFRNGKQDIQLDGKPAPECYTPFRGSRAICDADGSCEICGTFGIPDAFRISSNQFFSQLAVNLGREKLGETAGLVGIEAVDTPAEATTQGFFPGIWNVSNNRIAGAIAPARSTVVTGSKISLYDLGLEGMGQGYAGQMTPFQMALIASIPANMQGNLMKPKIEYDQPPQIFGKIVSPQQAAMMRDIMATVTEESGGTGRVVAAKLAGTGIRVGGKTRTAEKLAPLYNADGTVKTVKKKRRVNGQLVEYDAPVLAKRVDSWFISIAPLENPQVAIAVVVEGAGQGARTAAPIAADVILKAGELGLLGDQYKPKAPVPQAEKKRKKKK